MYNLINKMLANCVHLGHNSNLMNKSMKPYVINIKNKISIINLEKTALIFKKVLNIIKKLILSNKTILIVCTKSHTRNLIKLASRNINIPYVNQRWLGGTLTNFPYLIHSASKMIYLEKILKNEKILKLKKRYIYTYLKKVKKSKRLINGLKKMWNLPDFIFTIDSKKHKNLITEANKKNIPIACVVDTDSSTKNIDFVIPGNDDSIKSIFFFIKEIVKTIKNIKKKYIFKNEYK